MSTNRRQFLQGMAALGVAGALWPTSHSLRAETSPNERPVFAAIGFRNRGWDVINQSLQFADIAALADVDSKVLDECVTKVTDKQKKKPDAYKDYRKVLEREDIDAVIIATPDHWHTKIAVEAMRRGKDVYCEKPLTLTIDEGKLIEKVVKETGRVFQVGTQQRTELDKRFLTAIALIRHGRIGQLKKATCSIGSEKSSPVIPVAEVPQNLDWDFWLGPAPKVEYRALPELRVGYGGGIPLYSNCHYSFRQWFEYAGGQTTDWGAHHVDIACWALGEDAGVIKVTPVDYKMPVPYKDGYATVHDQYNAPTNFTIRAEMPNQVELFISTEGQNGILFEGTEGRFFVNRGKITGKPVEDLATNPLPEGAIEEVYGGPVSRNHAVNFFESMKSRKQPISDVWSHNRAMEVCHLSNIAMRLGRELNWDAAKRQITGDDQANSFLSRESRKGYEIENA